MLVVVRLSPLAKNVAQRNRVGYKFSHVPAVCDLTKKEIDEVKGDPFLKLCNHPSVAWFEAFDIERTQVNEDKWKKAPPTMDDINEAVAQMEKTGVHVDMAEATVAVSVTPAPSVVPTRLSKTSPDANAGQGKASEKPTPTPPANKVKENAASGNKPVELSASSPVALLIAALEKKGKKAGKDFAEDAKPDALFAMLKTL